MAVVEGLTDTQESYLEAAYLLEAEHRVARVRDITRALGVKAPSVTLVMRVLAAKGLIVYERYGAITLTARGLRAGEELALRRRATEDFLSSVLGVGGSQAREVAEKIEHHLPPAVLCRLVRFVARYKRSARRRPPPALGCADLCGARTAVDCARLAGF
jgi:DtxR family Mn-dependent transcriptional regulator